MVGADTEVLKAFLDSDSHGAAAAPKTHDKIGSETAAVDLNAEAVSIQQQIVFCEVKLFQELLAWRLAG
jgi:hypothetical protein